MKFPIISLFSGAMGLDLGLEKVGFETRVAVECDKHAAQTIRNNRPDIPVLEAKIEDLTTQEILEVAGLKIGEAFLVIGGPSCQAFSTAGKRGSLTDDRGTLFRHFLRVIREAKPQFFVMENVKGIMSAAVKHRPLNQRGPGFPPLTSDELLGSAFTVVAREICALGGHTVFDLLNSADYGSPQKRDRIIFIGSTNGLKINIPKPTHQQKPVGNQLGWMTLKDAIGDIQKAEHDYVELPKSAKKYISKIPAGGNWKSLPVSQQKDAVGEGVYRSWGGRTGFLRRLAWDKPSPALTTSPINRATLFAHPIKNRPLSIQEYARIQEFPDDWKFAGSINAIYKQIGNAVPVSLGVAIGSSILEAYNRNIYVKESKTIYCPNEVLINRLNKRNLTQLNPPEMSGIVKEDDISKWAVKSKEWINAIESPKDNILNYIST